MAARIHKIRHDDETRAKIQTSQLINRLTDHALSDLKLEPTQIRAIEILLKKTLPDLTNVELSGQTEHDVTVTQYHRVIVDPRNPNGESVPAVVVAVEV